MEDERSRTKPEEDRKTVLILKLVPIESDDGTKHKSFLDRLRAEAHIRFARSFDELEQCLTQPSPPDAVLVADEGLEAFFSASPVVQSIKNKPRSSWNCLYPPSPQELEELKSKLSDIGFDGGGGGMKAVLDSCVSKEDGYGRSFRTCEIGLHNLIEYHDRGGIVIFCLDFVNSFTIMHLDRLAIVDRFEDFWSRWDPVRPWKAHKFQPHQEIMKRHDGADLSQISSLRKDYKAAELWLRRVDPREVLYWIPSTAEEQDCLNFKSKTTMAWRCSGIGKDGHGGYGIAGSRDVNWNTLHKAVNTEAILAMCGLYESAPEVSVLEE